MVARAEPPKDSLVAREGASLGDWVASREVGADWSVFGRLRVRPERASWSSGRRPSAPRACPFHHGLG